MHYYLGDRVQALTYLQEALDTATKIGYQRGVSHAGNDMAGVYWQQGDFSRSLLHLQQALAVSTEIGDLHTTGIMIGNAGEIYRLHGNYDQALFCYEQGLYIISELGDRTITLNNVSNIAAVYTIQKRYDEAEHLLEQVIALRRTADNPYFLCEDLYRQANLYYKQHDYTKAQPHNQEALRVATEVGNTEIQFSALLLALRFKVALGQIDEPGAINTLETLLDSWSEDNQQAAIYYDLWRLGYQRETSYQLASELYHQLYNRMPNIEYRQRYQKMTGETLPDPPPLRPLPEVVPSDSINLQALFEKMQALNPQPD